MFSLSPVGTCAEPGGSIGGAAGVFPVRLCQSWFSLERTSILHFFLADRVCIGRGGAGWASSLRTEASG